jgi:hypothetical protein
MVSSFSSWRLRRRALASLMRTGSPVKAARALLAASEPASWMGETSVRAFHWALPSRVTRDL